MLTPPDAALAAREPRLPGLARLLDPGAMRDLLEHACPGIAIASLAATYVRYKRGTSCLVGYRAVIDGTAVDLYARAHRTADDAKLEKPAERRTAPSPLGPGILVLDEPAIVVHVHPNDHELPALARLASASSRRRLLARVLPEREDLHGAVPVRLRYKPERRAVARLDGPAGPAAVLKLHAAADFVRAEMNARAVRGLDLPVAPVLGRSRKHGILAYRWIEGRPVADALAAGVDPTALGAATGAALAALHGSSAALRVRYDPTAFVRGLDGAVDAIADIAPGLAGGARTIAARLADALAAAPWTRRPIHGDFGAEQVIATGDGAVIVDLDRGGTGDPAIDLGSARAAAAVGAPAVPAAFLDALEAAHARTTGLDLAHRTRLCAAAALLHRAVEPFRLRHDDWPAGIAARLDATARHLEPCDVGA